MKAALLSPKMFAAVAVGVCSGGLLFYPPPTCQSRSSASPPTRACSEPLAERPAAAHHHSMNRDDKNVFETLSSPVGVLVAEAQAIQYSFYTADELRKLSVVQVTSSEQRDALNRPLPAGLYDSKMGPTDHYESCATCGLDYSLCPGHIGHIDLALPAYAPILFTEMVKMLKAKCFNCHRFRADAGKLQNLARAAELLQEGRLVDAASVLEPVRTRANPQNAVGGALAIAMTAERRWS